MTLTLLVKSYHNCHNFNDPYVQDFSSFNFPALL